jgi:hypothetical protein
MVALLFVGDGREPLTVWLGRDAAIFGSPFSFVPGRYWPAVLDYGMSGGRKG